MENVKTSTQHTSMTSSKPCRYGDSCSRPGCRFRHSFDNAPQTPANLYCSNNWLPHRIRMKLTNTELSVSRIEDGVRIAFPILWYTLLFFLFKDANQSDTKSPSEEYTLTSVVCFINDPVLVEKRNLVALVRVPLEKERERSDGSVDGQWYIMNDFSISPVPAQEAVWFSLDWKVPCVLYYSTKDAMSLKRNVLSGLTKVKGHKG